MNRCLKWLVDAWKGDAKLWHVFWLGGLAIHVSVLALDYFMYVAKAGWGFGLVYVAWSIVASIWWYVAVWRSAPNVNHAFWKYAARTVVVVQLLLMALTVLVIGTHMDPSIITGDTVTTYEGYETIR